MLIPLCAQSHQYMRCSTVALTLACSTGEPIHLTVNIHVKKISSLRMTCSQTFMQNKLSKTGAKHLEVDSRIRVTFLSVKQCNTNRNKISH